MQLKNELQRIVGKDFVADGLGERYLYSFDMTENPPREPMMVVMPGSVEEIQAILHLANETRTPVVPFVTGQNVGGLTIPQVDGAVIIDLKRMDRILEVDSEAMYVVVEPGVTFGHLRKYLDENHPDLRYTFPLASPYASVLANALLQGLCDLSSRHGAMGDFINGLEAVLPTGELIRAGSGILGDGYWFSRYPLPDLVGLFSGWQGMTGIVTKIALQLWPRPEFSEHLALFTFGERETVDILKKMGCLQIIDDAICLSIPIIKMLIGVEYPVELYKGEPDYGTLISISGNTETEIKDKIQQIERIVNEAKVQDSRHLLATWDVVIKLMGEQAMEWVDFPSDAFKILTEFDGLTWVGTYIHPKHWAEALTRGRKIVEKYEFELLAFLKVMKGMHFSEFKFIIRFPKDQETLQRIRRCNEELFEMVLDLKALPYKTPVWAAKRLHDRIDPGFLELMKRIKQTLDPNGIMNPGRWGL